MAGPSIAIGARSAILMLKYRNAVTVVSATPSPHVHFARPEEMAEEKVRITEPF